MNNVLLIKYYDIAVSSKKRIICDAIKRMKNSTIIVDQANDVFEECEELRDIIDKDTENYCILMGRSLNIRHNIADITELIVQKGVVKLNYLFPLPL